MKSKKLVATVTSIAVGGALLVGTSFAALAETSGYDVYKAAAMNTKGIKNATALVTATVNDNNTQLLSVNANMMLAKDKNALSSKTEIKTSGLDKTQEMYVENGKTIMKSSDSDVYTEIDRPQMMNKMDKAENPEVSQSIEGLVDAVVGNTKDKFNVTENNGTKTVTASLSENDITPIENAVVNVVFSLSGAHRFNEDTNANKADLKNIVPQLKSNIKVEAVNLTATIDDSSNLIKDQDAQVTITGDDANGASHTVVIDVKADLSNVGSTTPQTVDLTGKTVKTITPGHGPNVR